MISTFFREQLSHKGTQNKDSLQHSASRTNTPDRFVALDGMRGVAALCVMIYHFAQHGSRPLFKVANLAVDFFFILSGFVICHAYLDRVRDHKITFSGFMSRRLVRLYPMFLLGIFLGAPILLAMSRAGKTTLSEGQTALACILNAGFVPYFNGGSVSPIAGGRLRGIIFPANDPAWPLSFEMLASACFLWMAKLRAPSLLKTCASFLGLTILFGLWTSIHNVHKIGIDINVGWATNNVIGGLPRVLYGFSCGMLLYRYGVQNDRFQVIKRTIGPRLNPIFLYMAVMLMFLVPSGVRGVYSLAVLTGLGPALIIVGSINNGGGKKSRRAGEMLGWLSYPIYCLHYPIGRMTWMMFDHFSARQSSSWPPVLVSCVATALCSSFLCFFVDQPLRRWWTSKLSRPTNAQRSQHISSPLV